MKENLEQHAFYAKLDNIDKEMLLKLRKAQKEQGDMLPLRTIREEKEIQEQNRLEVIKHLKAIDLKKPADTKDEYLDPINYMNEMKQIKHQMKQSGYSLVFKSSVATKKHFTDMLTQEPKILHISCHGVKQKVKTRVNEGSVSRLQRENCLVFETDDGDGLLMNSNEINKMIKKSLPNLDVVILAVCDSDFAGKIFLKCTAKHVICITKDSYVLDEVAIQFSSYFYQFIFEVKSVCESFKKAKAAVGHQYKQCEADMFQIYNQWEHNADYDYADDNSEELPVEHSENCMSNFNQYMKVGSYQCESKHVLIKQIPAKIPNLKFREKEMIELIHKIKGRQRIVMVTGLHGIGKSGVANNVLHHIYARKEITGGVLWVQLKGTKDVYAVLKELQKYIYKSLVLSNDEINEHTKKTATKKDLTDSIIEFFNNHQKSEFANKFRRSKAAKNAGNEFLICFDNAEGIIKKEKENFQLLLKNMIDHCPQLRLVITSNATFNEYGNILHPDHHYVSQLTTVQSVELFLETLEQLDFKDTKNTHVFDMICADKRYPIQKLLIKHPTKKLFPDQLADENFKKKMLIMLRSHITLVEALCYHALFKELAGNPTSIVILASVLANDTIKNCNTLTELYESTINERRDHYKEGDQDDDDASSREGDNDMEKLTPNNFALTFAIETSIKLLDASNKPALRLLYMLGCLPAGVTMQQLEELITDPEEPTHVLAKMCFTENDEDRIRLTPHMIEHTKKTIESESKEKIMRQISSYYIKILEEFYLVNSGE